MPKGQTTIPNLSVICPQCNSKEDIELWIRRLYYEKIKNNFWRKQ
jgi:hypothetical protein